MNVGHPLLGVPQTRHVLEAQLPREAGVLRAAAHEQALRRIEVVALDEGHATAG
jgi:hypothetical protein